MVSLNQYIGIDWQVHPIRRVERDHRALAHPTGTYFRTPFLVPSSDLIETEGKRRTSPSSDVRDEDTAGKHDASSGIVHVG